MRFFPVAFYYYFINKFRSKKHQVQYFFWKGNGNQTATYKETIDYYTLLANDFSSIKIIEMGATDSGEPLHLVILIRRNNLTSLKFKKQLFFW
jgi:hypothetical protein